MKCHLPIRSCTRSAGSIPSLLKQVLAAIRVRHCEVRRLVKSQVTLEDVVATVKRVLGDKGSPKPADHPAEAK